MNREAHTLNKWLQAGAVAVLASLPVGCATAPVAITPTTPTPVTITEVAVLEPPILYATKEHPCHQVRFQESGMKAYSTGFQVGQESDIQWWCDPPCECVEE